jgi:flagellar motor switch protein FliG
MIPTYRTIAASMIYFLSTATILSTSTDSTIVSALIGKLRLMRIFFDLKSNDPKSVLVALKQGKDITNWGLDHIAQSPR